MLLVKYHPLQFKTPKPAPSFCVYNEETWDAHLDLCEKLFTSGNCVILLRKNNFIEIDSYEEYIRFFRIKKINDKSVDDLCRTYGCKITTGVGDFQYASIKNISREEQCEYFYH